MKYSAVAVSLALACVAVCDAYAQDVPDTLEAQSSGGNAGEPGPPPGRKIVPQKEPKPAAQSYQFSSFTVSPEIVVSEMYDDNVYATQTNKIADFATIFSPTVWVRSNWSEHVLKFEAGGDLARYQSQTSQNSNDYHYGAEGRYDISADANVYGGVRKAQEHEDRESPDFRNGYFPTEYQALKGYAGWFKQFDRISVRVGGTAQKLDFSNVPFTYGVINNQDRNRTMYTGGARFAYELTPTSEVYLQSAVDDRRYQNVPDDAGYYRDSNGERFFVGSRINIPHQLRLDAFVGHMTQRYQDPRLGNVSTPMVGANADWYKSPVTTLSAYLDRTIEETTVFQTTPVVLPASSYVNTYTGFTANHKYTDRLSASANLSYSRNEFMGFSRTDNYTGIGFGTVYKLSRGIYLDTSYQHRFMKSGYALEDFTRNILFFRLAFALSPG